MSNVTGAGAGADRANCEGQRPGCSISFRGRHVVDRQSREVVVGDRSLALAINYGRGRDVGDVNQEGFIVFDRDIAVRRLPLKVYSV